MKRTVLGVLAALTMACGGGDGDEPLRYVEPTREELAWKWMYLEDPGFVVTASAPWCIETHASFGPALASRRGTLFVRPLLDGRETPNVRCGVGTVTMCSAEECVVPVSCCGPSPAGLYTIHATLPLGDGTALGCSTMVTAR